MLRRIFTYISLLLVLVFTSCSKFSRLQKKGSVQERYNGAIEYYNNKDYYRAGVLLEDLIPLIKGTAEAEKTQLYYSYCQFNQKQYVLSSYYFNRFTETFPRSEYVEEAMFMNVKSLYLDSPIYSLDQTNTYKALDEVQVFFTKYPYSKFAEECNKIVDELRSKLEKKAYEQCKLYYKVSDYKAAVISFDIFKKDFSESVHNEEFAYFKLDAQYQLSLISIETKKMARFEQAVEFYLNMVDKYPNSKYLKQSETIYADCVKHIEKIKNKS
ncbi:MAG: outer membrane protein assembly factor BamD [Bacteroidota bacterium]|jgi:outer membrane protein assembly factor BamD